MARICFIKCRIGVGMFEDEFVAEIDTFTSGGEKQVAHSIVSRKTVQMESRPRAGKVVQGRLRAYCTEERGNLVSVILPQSTIENGTSVVVSKEDVEEREDR